MQWLRRPKSTWIRKVVFQLHLWSGILLGFYVVVVSASGSAIVFRNDIYDWLEAGGKAVSYKAALYHWLSWLGKLHGSLLMEGAGIRRYSTGSPKYTAASLLVTSVCLVRRLIFRSTTMVTLSSG